MERVLFQGVMPALVTPFTPERKLIPGAVRALMDFELSRGVRGFYINGSTGEGPVLSRSLRMAMTDAAVEAAAGRGVVIDHVGAPDFEDALALAENARNSGVDAVSSLVPNFYYANTEDEIVDYYKRIAAAAEKPLLVYATPMITGDVVALMSRLLQIDGVIGCKFTRYNYYEMSLVKMLDHGNVNVINGPDEMLLAGLSMGADGGIGSTYNIMPERFAALYDAFRAGDLRKAREIQYGINRVIRVLIRHGKGNVVKTVKETLLLMGFDAGYAAAPAAPFDPARRDALKKDLIEAGLSLPV